MASPQGFSREAQGRDTWGSDQVGTRVGRAWMVNKEVSEGGTLGAGHPSSSLMPFWVSELGSPSRVGWGIRWSLEGGSGWGGRGYRETLPVSALSVPILPPGLCCPQACSKVSVCPSQVTRDHTRWEGLVADSFRCWASEATQDQRSRLLGAELFSDFGGRMSQPSRQCCGVRG